MAPDPNPLTVHVLDTARGQPAAGLPFQLARLRDGLREQLGTGITNADGRSDYALVSPPDFTPGIYEMVFDVGSWRTASGEADLGFYDLITIRFRVADPTIHHHIPLLLAPYGYTTYRGS